MTCVARNGSNPIGCLSYKGWVRSGLGSGWVMSKNGYRFGLYHLGNGSGWVGMLVDMDYSYSRPGSGFDPPVDQEIIVIIKGDVILIML